MHTNKFAKSDSFDSHLPKFKTVFEFLKSNNLSSLKDQVINLENGVRVIISSYDTEDESVKLYETHDRYFDIQYIISGCESIFVSDRAALEILTPYNSERDITFYKDGQYSSHLILNAGDYAFFDLDDAHKPSCTYKQQSHIRKAVFKIPV